MTPDLEALTDRERLIKARTFFWEAMDDLDQVVSVEVAQRQIKMLAEALPPFTSIKEKP